MSSAQLRSGRVESVSTSDLIRSGKRSESANDSVEQSSTGVNGTAPHRRYVTRSHVASVSSQINDRQRSILTEVDRLGVLTTAQLQRLYYDPTEAGRRLARKELRQLSDWQALTRLERPIGGVRAGSAGHAYALGPAGQRLLRPNRRRYRAPWTPQPGILRHAVAVSELYVLLREAERTDVVELAAFEGEPTCWRPFVGPGGSRMTLKPDALAVIHLGDYEDRYMVEVDCGTEPGPRIALKARTYIRYYLTGREEERTGVFPYVIWVTTTEARAGFLVRALSSLPAEYWRLFIVTTLDHAVEHLMTGNAQPISHRKEVKQ